MVGRKTLSKQTGIIRYTPLPFYHLTIEASHERGAKRINRKIGNISRATFEYESVFKYKIKKRKPKITIQSIPMFVSEENLQKTIETLRFNGAKNIKKIQHHLSIPKFCPECEKVGTTEAKLDKRYKTRHHKVRIFYNHKDKSKHYVATFDIDTGATTAKAGINPRKFLPGYWFKRFSLGKMD